MSNNLNQINLNYFEQVKNSLIDPLAKDLSEDVKWIRLKAKEGFLDYPIVNCGNGEPILFLHGFDSSFLEFRRIIPKLKTNFKIIIPDLFGFGFSPRMAGINLSLIHI